MNKKARIVRPIEGIKSAFFFHKDPKKSMLALFASMITEGRRQSWKNSEPSYEFYEYAAQRGKLGTLQKFLDSDDCETTTDGKLFNAYKWALADSDKFFGSLTGAVDWHRPWRSGIPLIDYVPMTDREIGQMLWMFLSVHDFAYFLSKYAATPPTLASVRYYFSFAYPQNAGLWPNDKDSNHDMARKLRKWKLPLTRGKAGRPRNRGRLQK